MTAAHVVSIGGTPLLSELAGLYLRDRLARREVTVATATNHRYILNRFSREVGGTVASLTVDAVEGWMADRASLRVGSRRTHFAVARRFCVWLTRRGYLESNPMLEVARPRAPRSVPRAMQAVQVGRFLGVLDRPRDRAMAALMVELGLRCCEVSGVDLDDWDRVAETLLVRGKGGHERSLPVTRTTTVALAEYVDCARPGAAGGPLFRSYREPAVGVSAKTVSRLMGEWMLLAGVKRGARDGVGAHALRHTCASDVLDRCGDLRVVKELLGHSNIATTSIYLRRANLGQMREAMEGRDYRVSG